MLEPRWNICTRTQQHTDCPMCATRGLNHYRTTRRIRAANVGTHKSRNKCDDNGSKRTTDGDSEEKKTVDAPAVPLSSIRDVFVSGGGGKCMYPFVDNVEDDHAASSSM